jgi:hypothetical protein
VDLIFDPGGLLVSTLATPIGLAVPVWRVKMNGDTTRFGAVAGAQTFLALDDAGRVHVNQAVGDVVRVEPDASLTTVVDADPGPPHNTRLRGITFDEQGRLYVLSSEESGTITRLRRFDLLPQPPCLSHWRMGPSSPRPRQCQTVTTQWKTSSSGRGAAATSSR